MKPAHFGLKIFAATALACVLVMGLTRLHAALAPTSYQMTDVITGGNGTNAGKGNIRVMVTKSLTSPLTGPDLEAFRAESADGKTLSFVVDVNENASGLETARAQGVAIKSAKLVVVGGAGAGEYTHFWTETQALITEVGTPNRKLWYTLMGDAGSNEITGRKIGNTVYDSTLKFEVPGAAGLFDFATSVTLVVELLKTDSSFGDPENFYDHSGGFEDIALITKATAKVFDVFVPYLAAVAFRTESPGAVLSPEGTITLNDTLALHVNTAGTYSETVSGTTYTYTIPADLVGNALIGDLGAAGYQIVAFEDRFPDTGDYDFNDVVVAHRLLNTLDDAGKVIAISGDAYLVARGAGGYNHRWSLDIPITGATVGAFICNVLKNESSTEIANSNILNSTDDLACKVTMVSGSTVARITGFRDTRALLPSMNTLAGDSPSRGSVPHMNFSIALSAPVAVSAVGTASPRIEISRSTLAMSGVAFDASLYKVTLASRDAQNKPYAMLIPSDWQVPVEGTDIGAAYPDFANFVTSSGGSNASWYQNPDQKKVVGWRVKDISQ